MAQRSRSIYASPVRPRLLGALLALATVAAALPARDALADFDPTGRGKKKPPPVQPGPGKPGPGAHKPGPGKPGPGPKPRPDDEEHAGKGGPGADALIARYTGFVLAQPS